MGPISQREPNWEAIQRFDPDVTYRYGYLGHIVHMAHPQSGAANSVCQKKRCTVAVSNWSFVTCAECLNRLPIAGRLKDGTLVYEVRAA